MVRFSCSTCAKSSYFECLNKEPLREGLFIRKNRSRWERLQQDEPRDADETAKDFVQLVDDLSYAKTFYPGSRVTAYINALATRIYLGIYQNRKEEKNLLLRFWKYDVPLTVYKHRRVMLFSFFIFFLFYTVGYFTSQQDPGFVRQVFGNGYVDQTEENIAQGNPFGIYAGGDPFYMWIGIMINNIIVSFTYFGKGVILGFLPLIELGKESMRVGVFHHLFAAKGHAIGFFLAVMIHGLLELSAIVLSCGAGVVMGISWFFPGTVRRLDAFKQGVKDGVKIVVGLVPVLVLAAFFEGFITRYYKMPVVLNVLLLLGSAAFVLYYFFFYPLQLTRKGKTRHV